MQTFLPYASFEESAKALDWQRLNAMRRETKSILTYLRLVREGDMRFVRQPLVVQWYGYDDALALYRHAIVNEWIERGRRHETDVYGLSLPLTANNEFVYDIPNWLGNEKYHTNHKRILIRKAHEHVERNKLIDKKYDYRFQWPDLKPVVEYIYPVSKHYPKKIFDTINPLTKPYKYLII